MTTITQHTTSISPSLLILVKNTLDLLNRIAAFIPAHTICLDGKPLGQVTEASIRHYVTENTYVPKISFMVHSEYIDSKLVFTSLKRAFYDFRENLYFDSTFNQISIRVPFETIEDLDTIWNKWLLFLSDIKWQQIHLAA